MGRPMKFEHMAQALNELGDEMAKSYFCDGKEDKSKRRVVLERCWDRAMRGEIAFIKMLAFLGTPVSNAVLEHISQATQSLLDETSQLSKFNVIFKNDQ